MSNNGSYGNERPPSTGEPDYANDPASGSFFTSDYKRHEDLKTMLDSNKDGLKLEAMKRIIGMVAKGKDASDLFPAVVKNVVSKNIEVKKLVYVYLVRYAEEQQDLALLSISTFQRALKDPNQLIRASALRVLSSIRVPVIIPIVMLAVKDAVNDMSPYVRKTVAHAIPKLYSLDQEQKDQLIEVIEKLLSDKTTLVVGSVVMAFEEVCPERIDLIHKNYRKLCNLLVDVEEWGQVVIIKMLTRYARTQFMDPNKDDTDLDVDDKPFYDDEENDLERGNQRKGAYVMDPDHRLLLRVAKPLLQSRNSSVVMAVAQLYHHLAPKSEVIIVGKALIRLLHNHREIQSVVLSNIATMSTKRKGMFEPYLKSFFIRSSDPTHIKLLKLEILTNLATETNISFILREFQTYVSSSDKEFVGATVQAIGRCASNIKEVTDTCLNGLVSLMSNRSEAVVAESVVVIKKLLQMQPSEHKDIIVHMTHLIDTITVPMARASILWLLGEYSEHVPKIAPDVLRKMAKTFIHEEDIVKLQVLTLATKLNLTNPKQTKLLCQYVLNLAKYDQNYDIRDRARFLRQLVFSSGEHENAFAKHCKKIFLSTKPAPLLESKFKDSDQYQLGSLSHYINMRTSGYQDLPEFPAVAPDPSVRNVEVTSWQEPKRKKQQTKKSFYSEPESNSANSDESGVSNDSDSNSDSENSNTETDGGSGSHSSGGSSSSSSNGNSSSSSDEDDERNGSGDSERKLKKKAVKSRSPKSKPIMNAKGDYISKTVKTSEESDQSSDDSSSDESSGSTSSERSDNADEEKIEKRGSRGDMKKSATFPERGKKDVDLLLDLNEIEAPSHPPATASFGTLSSLGSKILTPMSSVVTSMPTAERAQSSSLPYNLATSAIFLPTHYEEIVNKISGNGLTVKYRFTRRQNVYDIKMATIELLLTNNGEETITGIKVGKKSLALGMDMHAFSDIENLASGATISTTVGIDFNETTQPATFEIVAGENHLPISIRAPIGELLHGVCIGDYEFVTQQNKLKGLHENFVACSVSKSCIDKGLASRVYEVANVLQVQGIKNDEILRFAGQSMSSKSLVLLTIKLLDGGDKANIIVNCEKIVIGSMLLKEVKTALGK